MSKFTMVKKKQGGNNKHIKEKKKKISISGIVSCSLCFYNEGKILICNENRKMPFSSKKIPTYHLFGGKIEEKGTGIEPPLYCAIREFIEETLYSFLDIDNFLSIIYQKCNYIDINISDIFKCNSDKKHRIYMCNLDIFNDSSNFKESIISLSYNKESPINGFTWLDINLVNELDNPSSLLIMIINILKKYPI